MKHIKVDTTNTTPAYRKGLITEFYKKNRFATKKQGVEFLATNYPDIKAGGHRGMIQRLFPKGEAPWDLIRKTCPHCKVEAHGLEACAEVFGFRIGGTRLQSWCRECKNGANKPKKTKKNGVKK